MKEETFYFLGLPIRIRFFNIDKNKVVENDTFISDEWATTCTWLANDKDIQFVSSFKSNDLNTVVHETYHLFFQILTYIQEKKESFESLDGEMYAYNFEDLFINVKSTLDKLEKEFKKTKRKR